MLKVVSGDEFMVGKRTTAATKLADGDELLTVSLLWEDTTLVMQTAKDIFLRIDGSSIPEKKKGAIGVRGIRLAEGDELTAIYVMRSGENVTVNLKGKTISLNRLHIGTRDTKGVKK